MIIEGSISVKAALEGKHRTVECVYADQRLEDRNSRYILRLAGEAGIRIVRCTREEIEARASGKTHGGMIAEVSARTYDSLADALEAECPFLVFCEGIEDPFNLGYIMRTLYSAGCDGLLIARRNWQNAESTILKASAGAFDHLRIIMTDDPVQDIRTCRKHGVYVYAAMRKDAADLYDTDLQRPVMIMIGGEMRGLSKAVLQEAEQNLFIPYANDFRNALNASSAAAVIAYEVLRQRRNG